MRRRELEGLYACETLALRRSPPAASTEYDVSDSIRTCEQLTIRQLT